MNRKRQYINREISWLSFNARVLQEAEDPSVPLFERLRFIGIFSNNLDEFFRVRVASVRRMLDVGSDEALLGNFTPEQLYDKIQTIVIAQQQRSQEIYRNIVREMQDNNISIINENRLTGEQGIFVKQYFHRVVLPNLAPIMLNKDAPFPYLNDRPVYLAVRMSQQNAPEKFACALVRIPARPLSRYLVLPEKNSRKYVILLDDVIRYCMNDIFPLFNFDVFEAYTIKVTRDAELDLDDDISKSFIEKMELSLKRRKLGAPVRLLYDRDIPDDLLAFIARRMQLDVENMVPGGRYHNDKDLMNFPEIGETNHYYRQLPPVRHRDLPPHKSILKKLREKDVMLHYPYQNFMHVIDLLREAAIDPKVVEIGITIYRVADNSLIINALLNAIRNGKNVTAVMELQARFDEEANIAWSNKLQEEGANVVNGIPGMKIHAKLIWIKRKAKEGFRNYAYVGTGNFNESTARIYADEGLLTADPRIADEVANVFAFLRNNELKFEYKHLILSPFSMSDYFMALIDREVEVLNSGRRAYIVLKMNSLIDPAMMDKLCDAAAKGVKIRLIVRGIFGLRTNALNLHRNIEAVSIVDKYLEHSRVFMFGNGGDEQLFISSADWMPRNLHRRIEVACPVYSPEICRELKEMLKIQLQDNTKSRILDDELHNAYNRPQANGRFRAQEDFYLYIKEKNRITMQIYHNPRCPKSRAGLQFLEEYGYGVEVKNYMHDGLTENEVRDIVRKTGLLPRNLIRETEPLWTERYKDAQLTDLQCVGLIAANPRLLRRPVVILGEKAVIANPPSEIDKLL
ncbi:MAG: polyphosphate kinase 1 [Bacteroidales bacterium]|nr:polyphosphate kinase 1 [Bacteroidales bacterium]